MQRRSVLGGLAAVWIASGRPAFAASTKGQKLGEAARAQLGVTTGYDPNYTKLSYPGGDVPRSTGVCADVVIRAARDGLGLDLQKLVHEDMVRAFNAYPARRVWNAPTPGDAYPEPIEEGDILTWLLDARLPHVGIVVSAGRQTRVVHNIGRGVEESPLAAFAPHRAAGHYRWPSASY